MIHANQRAFRLMACGIAILALSHVACRGNNGGNAPSPDAGTDSEPVAKIVATAELLVGSDTYPVSVLARDALRSDISTQGLEYQDSYAPRLNATVERHRVGEILMQIGFVLRDVEREPSGDYKDQISTRMAPYMGDINSVIAVGGRVRFQIHCATPQWLATHPYSHSVLTGRVESSGEPVWACSAPTDLAAWREIMRGVGEHFGGYAGRIAFSIGSEPENYFAGSLAELLSWYTATAKGILASTQGATYRIGGLTLVGHREAALAKTAPTVKQDTVTFTKAEYDKPITQTWIEHCASEGLPLDLVTLHQFGGSAVPAVGTYWGRARSDISAWLEASGYVPAQVEVVIEDWPQWASYASNDTEYFAAHTASGIISMLDLSLREGATVRLLQGFLFDFGFDPGTPIAGFTGRPGLSNGMGIIKPVFNLNSLLPEVEGTLTPVTSSDPFVHAIAATGPTHTTVLVTNQIPLEYQIDRLYAFWEQRPITENHFLAEDLSGFSYNPLEIIEVFFGGVMPGWPEVIDAFLKDPSPIDLGQLSWPAEIRAQWEEMRRIGRIARTKRAGNTAVEILLENLPDGSYRQEHFALDRRHANTYSDRELLDGRLKAAQSAGTTALMQEILAINSEYDIASAKLPDAEVVLGQPRARITVEMEPNSVHVLRFTAIP